MAISIHVRTSRSHTWPTPSNPHLSYEVEVTSDLLDEQGTLLDQLIGFGLETLDAQVVHLRVVPNDKDNLSLSVQ